MSPALTLKWVQSALLTCLWPANSRRVLGSELEDKSRVDSIRAEPADTCAKRRPVVCNFAGLHTLGASTR